MIIRYSAVIDLSHALRPGIPVWPGDPDLRLRPLASVERDGYALSELTLGEHSGTHFGAPSHFHADGISADALPPASLIRPAVVIDARAQAAADPDYTLEPPEIERWEMRHGRIADGSVALLCTGWSERWDDPERYRNAGGSPTGHYPGFGLDAARFLAGERGVVGLGIDTFGIDAGIDAACSVNAWWLRGERFHLENLTNLDRLPPTGATLVIGVLKIASGSGGPARVLALV